MDKKTTFIFVSGMVVCSLLAAGLYSLVLENNKKKQISVKKDPQITTEKKIEVETKEIIAEVIPDPEKREKAILQKKIDSTQHITLAEFTTAPISEPHRMEKIIRWKDWIIFSQIEKAEQISSTTHEKFFVVTALNAKTNEQKILFDSRLDSSIQRDKVTVIDLSGFVMNNFEVFNDVFFFSFLEYGSAATFYSDYPPKKLTLYEVNNWLGGAPFIEKMGESYWISRSFGDSCVYTKTFQLFDFKNKKPFGVPISVENVCGEGETLLAHLKNNSVLISSFQKMTSSSQYGELTSVYTIDPFIGTKQELIASTQLPKDIYDGGVEYNSDKDELIFLGNKVVYLYNINSKNFQTVSTTVDLREYHVEKWNQDDVCLLSWSSQEFIQLNIATGESVITKESCSDTYPYKEDERTFKEQWQEKIKELNLPLEYEFVFVEE